MDPLPPGLINRYVYSRRDGLVVIEETWDVGVSGCPMIPNPWVEHQTPIPRLWVRRVQMTQEQFANSDVRLLG